ncbi:hypothetical protein BDR22DRAFT_594000 [Usnea florida]
MLLPSSCLLVLLSSFTVTYRLLAHSSFVLLVPSHQLQGQVPYLYIKKKNPVSFLQTLISHRTIMVSNSYQASVAGQAGPDLGLPTITVSSHDSHDAAVVTTTVFNPSIETGAGAASPPPLSPHAAELVSVLTTAKAISDTALYEAALAVQQAMEKYPGQFAELRAELNNLRKPTHSAQEKRHLTHRNVEEEEQYSRKHHDLLQETIRKTVQSMGKTTSLPPTNPTTNLPLKRRNPNSELHIAMNARMQPIEGKRIRKPRLIYDTIAPIRAPKKPTKKRARENICNNDATAPDLDQPATKKRNTCALSFSPEPQGQTAPDVKKEPGVDGEDEAEEGNRGAFGEEKEEMKGKGKNPLRAAAARLMWEKRKAKGTNGRYGGRPKENAVARARGRGKVEKEGE